MSLHIKIDDDFLEDEIRRIAKENQTTLKSTVLRMLTSSVGECLPDIQHYSRPEYLSSIWYVGQPEIRDITVPRITGIIAGLVGSYVETYGNIPNIIYIPEGETHARIVHQAIQNYGLDLALGSTELDMGLIAVGYITR